MQMINAQKNIIVDTKFSKVKDFFLCWYTIINVFMIVIFKVTLLPKYYALFLLYWNYFYLYFYYVYSSYYYYHLITVYWWYWNQLSRRIYQINKNKKCKNYDQLNYFPANKIKYVYNFLFYLKKKEITGK